jgi:hypothetical protein
MDDYDMNSLELTDSPPDDLQMPMLPVCLEFFQGILFPDICHSGVRVPQTSQVSLPGPFQDHTYMNDPFPEGDAGIAGIQEEAFAMIPAEDDPQSLQEAQGAAYWLEWEAFHAGFFQSNETLPPQHQSHMGQLVRLCRVIYRHS